VRELGNTSLYFVPLTGERRKLGGGTQVFNGLSIANNGQAATVRSTPLEPGHLVTFNVAHPTAAKTLVDVNADVLDGRKLGQVDELWFASKDGLKVQGWLVKPVDFQPGTKYRWSSGSTAARGRCTTSGSAGPTRTSPVRGMPSSTRTPAAARATARSS